MLIKRYIEIIKFLRSNNVLIKVDFDEYIDDRLIPEKVIYVFSH